MFMRNVLLAIGAVFVLAGVALVVIYFNRVRTPPAPVETAVESRKVAVLVASHAIQRGAEVQPGDIASKEVAAGEIQPQTRQRGQEAEFVGKFSQRDIAEGETLLASDFISASCLAALVDAGYRAVSIAVDAPQSVTGMAQRGDRVDVILTQTFDEKIVPDLGRRTVGETVLENVRVLATDQNMKSCPNQPLVVSSASGAVGPEGRLPKTVTLELKEAQAEKLMVAAKLGTFQLALRPLKNDAARPEDKRKPVWASDVSPAINEIAESQTPAEPQKSAEPQAPGEPRKSAEPQAPGEPQKPRHKQVSVRVYTGVPASAGYLCTKSSCVPSLATTITAERAERPEPGEMKNQPQIYLPPPRY
jgi:pilus assembly protein CpaB